MKKIEYDDYGANSFLSNDQSDNTPSRLAVDEDCNLPEKKRKKVIKTEDDSTLPNPFPLPKLGCCLGNACLQEVPHP